MKSTLKVSCFVVCLWFVSSASGVELLFDDFDDNSLDPAKWTVNTNIPQGGASVTEQNMRAEFVARGHLNTANQYNPDTVGGLHITGTWTVVNHVDTDFVQILTRSDGTPDPGNCCGETQNGVEFFTNINNSNQALTVRTRGGNLSVGQVNSFGNINATTGDVFDFEIIDNGGFLSFRMTEQGDPSSSASVTARLNSSTATQNYVTFHNRESAGRAAAVDNVSINSIAGNQATAVDVPTGGILPTLPGNLSYAKGDAGWDVTDTYYNATNIVAVGNGSGDDGFGNGPLDGSAGIHNALIARGNVNPASIVSSTNVRGVSVLDFSDPQNGSGRNYNLDLPFVGNTGADDQDFTTRAVGLLEISTPGDYTFRHSADDTTYFQIDTVVDGIITADTACCGSVDTPVTFTEAGLFPIEFVFGERGGGAGFDFLVNGPGTNGNFVLVGDTLSGSPGVFLIETVAAVPEPASVMAWLLLGAAGYLYRRRQRQK